ncbi:MAG TPA: MBL fold metallo-hydrolase [Actinomycetota bacterium]|nr:MBL fold metallo-hydrolase [Actinomycetota bacterium]
MELTVLGADGTYPRAHSACSGFLLQHDGFTLWMDAGNGTLSFLQEHLDMVDVDAIFLSHAHVDHCADVYPFFYQTLNTRKKVPVYAATCVQANMTPLIGDDSKREFGELFEWHPLASGDADEAGPFRFEVFNAAHSIENATVRVSAGGRTLCYSGDTGPNADLSKAARGADLFLCEASWLEKDEGLMAPIHLRATQAGEAAREAGVERLMLTHIWPRNPLDQVREEASSTFDGSIEFAREIRKTNV